MKAPHWLLVVGATLTACAEAPAPTTSVGNCPQVLRQFNCVGPVSFTFEDGMLAIDFNAYQAYARVQNGRGHFISLPDGRAIEFDGSFAQSNPLQLPSDALLHDSLPFGEIAVQAVAWSQHQDKLATQWLHEQGRIY